MLGKLNLRSKLLLTSALPLLAIVALAALAFPTFQTVKVNGPEYKKVVQAQDVEADILPPPAYLIAAHFEAAMLSHDAGDATTQGRLAKIETLEKQFEAAHQRWQRELRSDDPTKAAMQTAFVEGRRYFTVYREQFRPLLDEVIADQTKAPQAEEMFDVVMQAAYEKHRVAIDKAVAITQSRQTKLEAATSSLISNRLRLLLGLAAAALALVAVASVLSARSISRPVEALTRVARDAADHELPRAVSRIQSGETGDVDQFDTGLADDRSEIGELARALDSMHGTALRLALDQARIRRNVSDNLVNVARRNQVLLKRTLSSLSKMEQEERDPQKLEQLFRLDHLSTRIRRNAESLLVLAGSESPKLWSTPVGVGDVVRSAISQIEAYDQVEYARLDVAMVKGSAVSDLSHILAELIENATFFSPPGSMVTVTGRQRMDGYVLVVSDDGVGMSVEDMAEANRRIANPTEFDLEPTKVLGHLVSGQLAARYGIKITITESLSRGTAVQVLLPSTLLESNAVEEPGLSGFDRVPVAAAPASAPAAIAPTSAPQQALSLVVPSQVEDFPSELPVRAANGEQAGLKRRVRGANLPDLGPTGPAAVPGPRSAVEVRSSLSSLQSGVAAALRTSAGAPKSPQSDVTPAHRNEDHQ